jgi:hypothetical protein
VSLCETTSTQPQQRQGRPRQRTKTNGKNSPGAHSTTKHGRAWRRETFSHKDTKAQSKAGHCGRTNAMKRWLAEVTTFARTCLANPPHVRSCVRKNAATPQSQIRPLTAHPKKNPATPPPVQHSAATPPASASPGSAYHPRSPPWSAPSSIHRSAPARHPTARAVPASSFPT